MSNDSILSNLVHKHVHMTPSFIILSVSMNHLADFMTFGTESYVTANTWTLYTLLCKRAI
jgi:hypothetical protein